MTMHTNENTIDVILSKMVARMCLLSVLSLAGMRNFVYRHGQTPSDKSSFVCFLCAIHLCHCFESVLWLQIY